MNVKINLLLKEKKNKKIFEKVGLKLNSAGNFFNIYKKNKKIYMTSLFAFIYFLFYKSKTFEFPIREENILLFPRFHGLELGLQFYFQSDDIIIY